VPRAVQQQRERIAQLRVEPLQRRLGDAGADARVVAGVEVLHAAVEQRDEGEGARVVERAHAVFDGIDMRALEARDAAAGDFQARAARRLPLDRALEHTGAEVERALVAQQPALAQIEALAGHPQLDALAVGHVEHELAVLGQAIGRLRIADRLGVEEAVEIAAVQRWHAAIGKAFVVRAAQPDVAVAEREQGLAQRVAGGVEARLGEPPRLRRERQGDVVRIARDADRALGNLGLGLRGLDVGSHHEARSRGCARPSAANTCKASAGRAKGSVSPMCTSARAVFASKVCSSPPTRR
jgi:hypothetical protein